MGLLDQVKNISSTPKISFGDKPDFDPDGIGSRQSGMEIS